MERSLSIRICPSSTYVPAATLIVLPATMSMASWIEALSDRTFTVSAVPLSVPASMSLPRSTVPASKMICEPASVPFRVTPPSTTMVPRSGFAPVSSLATSSNVVAIFQVTSTPASTVHRPLPVPLPTAKVDRVTLFSPRFAARAESPIPPQAPPESSQIEPERGSMRNRPKSPLSALVLTRPVMSTWGADTSTKPPSPLALGPPWALIEPWNCVSSFAHATTVPPSPVIDDVGLGDEAVGLVCRDIDDLPCPNGRRPPGPDRRAGRSAHGRRRPDRRRSAPCRRRPGRRRR
jgi:hypothetical protein